MATRRFPYTDHFVAFVDILGFRSLINRDPDEATWVADFFEDIQTLKD